MWMDKYLKRPCAFSELGIAIFAYMNIFDMRTMILCHRNEKKINKKFVLLKVASDKMFGQHFPQHSTALRPLTKMGKETL